MNKNPLKKHVPLIQHLTHFSKFLRQSNAKNRLKKHYYKLKIY